jgi:hypothetical protein
MVDFALYNRKGGFALLIVNKINELIDTLEVIQNHLKIRPATLDCRNYEVYLCEVVDLIDVLLKFAVVLITERSCGGYKGYLEL